MIRRKPFNKFSFYYRAFKYRFKKDKAEIRFLSKILAPGSIAIDVGAHKGAYTFWLRRAVSATGKIVAFEPQPILYDYLEECVEKIHWNNVIVENYALSSTPGEMSLYVPSHSPSPGATLDTDLGKDFQVKYIVKVDTLDSYVKTHSISKIHFIKCDVEGHELEVFRGAETILSNHSPILMFECEQRHNKNRSINDTFDYLASLGYKGFFYLENKLLDIAKFDVNRHQILGKRPYINNFIFYKSA
jgi:FkbM family methyltransferase